ncbi:MAG: 5'-deoxynucleotidase [Clostridia bacterium]|nr:5'-deoxynucleotidase [Clostridia bacterium]
MNNFFAFLYRTKYINRWGLMRNTESENLMEHSYFTALIAHSLATISNTYFGNDLNADQIATMALFHDTSEIFTGDMPTPVKYLNSQIRDDYKKVEKIAEQKLLDTLPDQLKPKYDKLLTQSQQDSTEHQFVKYADKLSAYIKCVKEISYGNNEFKKAKESIQQQLTDLNSKEVDFFVQNFIPAFLLTLDELQL